MTSTEAEHIDPGDVELLEAAGVPEFKDEDDWWTDVDPLVAPCSVCGATAYTVENNEPRCPEHLEPLGKP